MGLFGNSISDNILSEVQTINRCVTHIEQLFNKYRGVVPANASKIENMFDFACVSFYIVVYYVYERKFNTFENLCI